MIPDFLLNLLNKQYDTKTVNEIICGYKIKRKTTFRVNRLKVLDSYVLDELDKLNIKYEKYEYLDNAYIINIDAKELYNHDLVKNGYIYFQSISSMLPPYFLEPKEGETILDMCAAPGGKTICIGQLTNNEASITALETNKIRFERLKHNLEVQGVKAFILNQDATKIDDFFRFDKILLDAPCSGSGTLNLDDDKQMKSFSYNLIKNSSTLQEKLLDKALTILKPKSSMIYSTCSILDLENENVLNKLLKKHNAKVVPIEASYLPLLKSKIDGTLLVKPTELFEGFFIAKIYKN